MLESKKHRKFYVRDDEKRLICDSANFEFVKNDIKTFFLERTLYITISTNRKKEGYLEQTKISFFLSVFNISCIVVYRYMIRRILQKILRMNYIMYVT